MQILEYDDIDPLDALHLSLMDLDFALTPEHAAHLRHTDPRPFPCLAIYALEGKTVVGQAGLLRLPLISAVGREDVGGIWAVATHPHHARGSAVSHLIEEAHARMRQIGLRFSTIHTDRFRNVHTLYRQHGYVDMQVWATALAPWEKAHRPTRLRARPPGSEAFHFLEKLFAKVAAEYLGFAYSFSPFAHRRDALSLDNIWIIWQNDRPVGYALIRQNAALLDIHDLVIQMGIDVSEAVAAVAAELKSDYVQIKVSRPVAIAQLQHAGWRIAHPDWSSFMVKSLVEEISDDAARRLFGIGTDNFLISCLDRV